MEIDGVFRLRDGRTAIAGTGEGWAPVVRQAPSEIVIDGEVSERFAVSTEMLDPNREGRWSFGTMEEVQLQDATITASRCVLRSASDQ